MTAKIGEKAKIKSKSIFGFGNCNSKDKDNGVEKPFGEYLKLNTFERCKKSKIRVSDLVCLQPLGPKLM